VVSLIYGAVLLKTKAIFGSFSVSTLNRMYSYSSIPDIKTLFIEIAVEPYVQQRHTKQHYNEGQHLNKARLACPPLVCLQSTPLVNISTM